MKIPPYRAIQRRFLLGLLGALLLLASILFANRSRLGVPCVDNMDRAYTHLSVAMAERGESFEGAFSHAGFRHPGPSLFYYLAGVSYALAPWTSRENSFRLAIALLNSAFIGISIFLLSGLTSRWTYALILAPISFTIVSPRFLFDYWNPSPVPAATIAYLLSITYLAHGRVSLLPLAIALGSFIAHCHLGSIPFLGVCLLYSVMICFWKRHSFPTRHDSLRAPCIASALVAIVFWLGPIIDIARYGLESNPIKIFLSFVEQHPTPDLFATFTTVWKIAAKKLSLSSELPALLRFITPAVLWAFLIWMPAQSAAFFHLRILLALGWGTSVWALAQSFQPMASYLVSYFLGILAIAVTIATFSVVGHVASIIATLGGLRKIQPTRIVMGAALGSCLLLSVYLAKSGDPQKKYGCYKTQTAQRFVTALAPESDVLYEIAPSSFDLRNFAAFFALQLLNRQTHFCFVDSWLHYVGRSLTCSYQRASHLSLPTIPVELAFKDSAFSSGDKPARGSARTVGMTWRVRDDDTRSFEFVWQP